ncbi:bifunctional diaminohydroxyphosphoribosylaminopyrimidine deaminase/5-amino-6-(5-phosphoribosylamino)uracil reductase RibD [Acidothermaceae bacterium B102]|nr:bifunctional diaminohydroxyphosphoribosylaminopyrimidine deaminase/5-amino-6-(5-phosphoribosylamino)uracil reductase RibD [Acidothermaceae bacterium B102]
MATPTEQQAMRRALALAAAELGRTGSNPVVGAVVLDSAGTVVGEGAHTGGPGHPHAEVVALRAAGDKARGGTVVCTLEPCNHTGRTGPCSQALIAAGVSRVVYAVEDPSAPAAGGAATLRAAGVDVEAGLLADEAERGNEAWLLAARTGRPFVTWKYAATLDGRSAAADGTSRWITSDAARADVHRLRGQVDAVVAGVGTVLADDPLLTARTDDAVQPQPLRIVLDSDGRTPADARVLGPGCLVVVGDGCTVTWPATEVLVAARDTDGHVDLGVLLKVLGERGLQHLFLEGGPTLAGAFLRAGLVDRVVAYLAPTILGAGTPALVDPTVTTLTDARRFRFDDIEIIGPDVRIIARPVREDS